MCAPRQNADDAACPPRPHGSSAPALAGRPKPLTLAGRCAAGQACLATNRQARARLLALGLAQPPLALTLYNVLVWLATREHVFGLYVLYASSFFLRSVTFRGFAFEWLWPGAPDFNNQVLAITTSMSFVGYAKTGGRDRVVSASIKSSDPKPSSGLMPLMA